MKVVISKQFYKYVKTNNNKNDINVGLLINDYKLT